MIKTKKKVKENEYKKKFINLLTDFFKKKKP